MIDKRFNNYSQDIVHPLEEVPLIEIPLGHESHHRHIFIGDWKNVFSGPPRSRKRVSDMSLIRRLFLQIIVAADVVTWRVMAARTKRVIMSY